MQKPTFTIVNILRPKYVNGGVKPVQKAEEIRRRFGGSGSLLDPFPDKPKGMHWTTYWRLRHQSEQAASMALGGMARRLGVAFESA